jgi:hypothetical protein
MSNCLYCANRVLIHPGPGTRWEPEQHHCEKGWLLTDGNHGCADYEREPGADDDMGEPLPHWPPVDNA